VIYCHTAKPEQHATKIIKVLDLFRLNKNYFLNKEIPTFYCDLFRRCNLTLKEVHSGKYITQTAGCIPAP
jgi:hypothetical protein